MISKDNVNGFFALIGNSISDSYTKNINRHREEAFNEAMEIGLGNAFAALYDANVNDDEIICVVCKYWKISKQKAVNYLICEKEQAAIRNLRKYMRLQGYRASEIIEFFQVHNVSTIIKQRKELWKLKNNPERLFKIMEES